MVAAAAGEARKARVVRRSAERADCRTPRVADSAFSGPHRFEGPSPRLVAPAPAADLGRSIIPRHRLLGSNMRAIL
jgi:hypothetical protein